ncbi:hypothetical protein D3C71_1694030 [compost metagenome]
MPLFLSSRYRFIPLSPTVNNCCFWKRRTCSTGTAIPMAKKASLFPTTICALRSFLRLQRKSQSVRLTAGSPISFTHMTGTRP